MLPLFLAATPVDPPGAVVVAAGAIVPPELPPEPLPEPEPVPPVGVLSDFVVVPVPLVGVLLDFVVAPPPEAPALVGFPPVGGEDVSLFDEPVGMFIVVSVSLIGTTVC